MKIVDHVSISLKDASIQESETFNGPTSFEEACIWLLGHGIYDEIDLKKSLTVEKAIADRLKS